MSQTKRNSSQTLLNSLYAFAVVWLACFIVLGMFRKQGPDDYISRSTLEFDVQAIASRRIDAEPILRDAVQRVVEPSNLKSLVDRVSRDTQNGWLTGDTSQLLRSLEITWHDGKRPLLSVAYFGSGNEFERKLVNQIVNAMAIESSRRYDQGVVKQWLNSVDSTLDPTRQVHLARQIHDDLSQAQGQLDEMKATDWTATAANETSSTAADELTAEIARLKAQHQYEDTHPEIVSRQRRLEAIRATDGGTGEFRPSQVPSLAAMTNDSRQKNPYYQTSERTNAAPTTPTFIDPRRMLESIDLTDAQSAAIDLMSQAESTLDVQNDLSASLANYFETESEFSQGLLDIHPAKSSEIRPGRSGVPAAMMWLPSLLAALVCLMYDPLRERMRINSIADVSRILGAPILGRLPTENLANESSRVSRVACRVVKLGEYVTYCGLGLIVIASVVKPSMGNTMLQQPLYGLAHWLSMILS